ncbi:hypothetical protein CYMTET_12484 [Cymbomonas tetramitiformis]|uniref:Uncharacterized protein n=1 Tax=Cymbomonas tetramitiformis TaxID=36881 RepID=A0AAE0GK71_9CHLO|nr:hypothetical protein CYMTET_12484 [Cymbomonas tetramitiformis]
MYRGKKYLRGVAVQQSRWDAFLQKVQLAEFDEKVARIVVMLVVRRTDGSGQLETMGTRYLQELYFMLAKKRNWGAKVRGFWCNELRQLLITHLELEAVFKTVQAFLCELRGKVVGDRNTSTMTFMNLTKILG